MDQKKPKKVYVIGHKNPDTDSICSAIAYANLKNKITGEKYIAKRAGEVNGETAYVLDKFQVSVPSLLENVHLQVKDMDIRHIEGVSGHMSIKDAWARMKDENIKTLPVTRGEKLEGLITIGDIATSYMEVYDNNILATARTQYRNIVKTLDGTLISGNEHGYFLNGKVVIAASSPDLMENFIEKDDLVILGNRYESQLCAIEMDASCLVICQGANISKTIKKMAEERDIVIIQTPHDTFTAARLINQSIPVKYFMSRDNLEIFHLNDYVEHVKEVMSKTKYRDFPILDNKGKFCGFLSRRRLMTSRKKQVILVDHNEKKQSISDIETANIVEIVDHHRIGDIETDRPIVFRNMIVGSSCTIVGLMYAEYGVKMPEIIAKLIAYGMISDTMNFNSPTCTTIDRNLAKRLSSEYDIDFDAMAKELFENTATIRGKEFKNILYNDVKEYMLSGYHIAVSQVFTFDLSIVDEIKEDFLKYMDEQNTIHEYDLMLMVITNVEGRGSRFLYVGKLSHFVRDVVEEFKDQGFVSRKKQIVPRLAQELA